MVTSTNPLAAGRTLNVNDKALDQDLRSALGAFDTDGNGNVDANDLKRAASFIESCKGPGKLTKTKTVSLYNLPDSMHEALSSFDANGTGEISIDSIREAAMAMKAVRDDVRKMRQAYLILAFVFVCLCWSIFGLMYWVVQLTKDVEVKSHDPVLRTTEDGSPVVTENPHSYVTLRDLPTLSKEALDNLGFISFFTTQDGVARRYNTVGFQFNEYEQGGLEVFFDIPGYSLVIGEEEIEFRVKVDGVLSRYQVAGAEEEVEGAARRRLFERAAREEEHASLLDRCSPSGVCLHTREEIFTMHRYMAEEARGLVDAFDVGYDGRRRLNEVTEDTVTYAELDVDSATYAVYQSVLEEVAAYQTDAYNYTYSDQRSVFEYDLYERCDNYALSKCGTPVPEQGELDAIRFSAPYRGLDASEGQWYFKDQITYEEDDNIIKVSVRFAHDPHSDTRRHVIMMSKLDDGRYFQYDEVTHNDVDTTNERVDMMNCFAASPTNETMDEGISVTDEGERRRLVAERARERLHRHLRTRIRGFGNLRITHRQLSTDDVWDDDGWDEDEEVDVEFETDSADSSQLAGTIDISNSTAASGYDSTYNETLYSEVYGNASISASADLNGTDTDVSDADSPMSYFGAPLVDLLNGTLSWPDDTQCVIVEGYEDDVPDRDDLDADYLLGLSEEDDDASDDAGNSTRRLEASERPPVTAAGRKMLRKLDQAVADYRRAEEVRRERRRLLEERHEQRRLRLASFAARRRLAGRTVANSDKWQTKISGFISAGGDALADYASDFKSQLYGLRENFVDNATAYAINAFDALTPENGLYYYTDISDSCEDYVEEVVRMDEHIQFFLEGTMQAINDGGTYVLDAFGQVDQVETDLEDVIDVFRVLDPILGLLSAMPYVGMIFSGFRKVCAYANRWVVQPAQKNVQTFNNRLAATGIEDKIEELMEKNDEAGEKLAETKVYMLNKAEILPAVDAACPDAGASAVCGTIADVFEPFNDGLDAVKSEFNAIATAVTSLNNYIGELALLTVNKQYTTTINFFDGIYSALEPLIDLLYSSIGIWLPIVETRSTELCANIRYPCGTNMCQKRIWCGTSCKRKGWRIKCKSRYCNVSYPCGIKWCSRRVCTRIHYPVVVMKYFSFRVVDLITGAVSALNFVIDALMNLLQPLLDAIGIPSLDFQFPGLPSLFNVELLDILGDYEFPVTFEMDLGLPTLDSPPFVCVDRRTLF